MRLRICLAILIASAFAADGFALSGQYLDWGNGPAQYLMTREEAARWKALTSDEDAAAFVALFWARRDPTPETPRNEFRERFEERVVYADQNLEAGERRRGSMTDRGRIRILYGPPKRIVRAAAERIGNTLDRGRDLQEIQRESRDWEEWIYEDDPAVRAMFGVARASIRFVDKLNTNEYKVERGAIDLAASQQRAIKASLTQPDLTEAPQYAAAPAAAPSGVANGLTTETLKAAVASYAAATPARASIAWGEYVTGEGHAFVPVMFYVPQGSALQAGQDVTFFGVVRDASGKEVATFEEPAKLAESKGDLFVDRTFVGLPAGRYDGVFGIAAAGQSPLLASSTMELTASTERVAASISPLILSNNLYPLTESWLPTAPFVFGGLKVVPKADRAFRTSDDLWFFVELRNPGVSESVLPEGVVPVAGAAPAMPSVQVKLDLEGVDGTGTKVRRGSPPREVQPVAIQGVSGHFGLGDSIPLASFKPGEYTLNVKVIDTITKKSYTLAEKFRIVE